MTLGPLAEVLVTALVTVPPPAMSLTPQWPEAISIPPAAVPPWWPEADTTPPAAGAPVVARGGAKPPPEKIPLRAWGVLNNTDATPAHLHLELQDAGRYHTPHRAHGPGFLRCLPHR